MKTIEESCLQQLFHQARTHKKWHDKPIAESVLHEIYSLARLGPTSANCSPLRICFLKTKEAKERLKPHLDSGNVDKTMAAPVTALLAYDLKFYEYFPKLYPFAEMKSRFEGKSELVLETAFRNSTLQAAYFIMAARACGLDCGPMSGFSNRGVDQEFFPDGRYKSNFLCNLGHGDPSGLPGPRSPRLSFDEACQVL